MSSSLPHSPSSKHSQKVRESKNLLLPPLHSSFDGDFSKLRNPFVTPKDVEWVEQCQEEKNRLMIQRRNERLLRPEKKQTYRSRVVGSTLPTVRKFFKELDDEFEKEMEEFNKSLSNQIWASSGKIRIRPLENETNYEFKERKREIFLVKYTLQAKLDEIECYKAREAKEEKKIEELAERLRNEAVVFDDFLKSTDRAAAEAMKTAEKEAKLKMEKTIEVRRLQGELGVLKADVARKDELLCEYYSYKSFLLMFHYNANKPSGPDLSFEMWEKKRVSINKKRKKASLKKSNALALPKALKKRSLLSTRRDSEASLSARRSSNQQLYIPSTFRKTTGSTHFEVSRVPDRVLPSQQIYPEEWEEDDEESTTNEILESLLNDPYFVIDAIHEKEEESLRLIYRLQALQDALDEQKRFRVDKLVKKNKELERLIDLVKIMKSNIDNIEIKCDELKLLCKLLGADEQASVDDSLITLTAKVEKVYCGVFGRVLVRLDGLAMLSCIEKRFDQLLDEVESLPEENVRVLQKIRDKERRLAQREDKLIQQKLKQEERLRKAMERANRMSQRNFGRKLMFRSEPPKLKMSSAAKHDAPSDTESVYFFTV